MDGFGSDIGPDPAAGAGCLHLGGAVYVKDRMTIRADEIIYEWGKSLI
jgi:hypothetical protein